MKKLSKRDYIQVLFVFIAFTLMVAIGSFTVSDTIRKASFSTVMVALEETEKTIRAYLREPKIAFDNIYLAIQRILDRGESQEEVLTYLNRTTNHLSQLEDGVQGFITVYGLIRDEMLIGMDVTLADDYVAQQRPWYQIAIRNEGIGFTAPYIDAFTGETIISLSQEIYGADGEYYGVLAMDVDISWLMGYVESLQFAEGGYGMIVNQFLYVIVHPFEEFMDMRLQDIGGVYREIADTLRIGEVVSARRIQDFDGTDSIVSFKKLYNGWQVGVIIPTGSFYKDLYFNIVILVVLGIMLSIILSCILLRLSTEKTRSEEESKAKSSFLATMSHEIRTPLNAIIGIAQIQMQNNNLPIEYAKAQEKILSSGNNLMGIINDILDMSKIETGKLELNPNAYDTPSLINDTVQLNIVRVGSKPIEFILEIDENLPVRIFGDELRIKQILNNLLSNAIKYTDKGYVKLSVSHWVEDDGLTLCFSVEDTGQGMKHEDRQRFFTEYQRFNAETNRETEGTGLGLSITKKLVEMMDGTIWVESEYGKGTVFLVAVRQMKIECEAIGAELAKQLKTFTFTNDRQIAKIQISRELMPYGRVLVVDDVETNLYVAKGLLLPYKLGVETKLSGFEAIENVLKGNVYDIIFMDHMMPKMDGIETTRKLRELGYKGTIVALTANALVGNDEMFALNGFDGFIPKPIDVGLLNDILNKFIRDRYPEEAKKYRAETILNSGMPAVNPMMLKIFCRDAKKAIVTLKETYRDGDLKLFTTTVHAMKSALLNIGKKEASGLARELENAGLQGDTDFIKSNIEVFLESLKVLTEEHKEIETAAAETKDITQDTNFLKEQLQIVKAACGDYDIDAAYTAIDRLKEEKWNLVTAEAIEAIWEELFLSSDFEAAAEKAEKLLTQG